MIKDVLEQTSAQGSKFGTLESKVSHMVSMVAHWKPSTFHNVVRKSQEALSSFVEHQEIEEMDETEDSDEVFEIDFGNYISSIFFFFNLKLVLGLYSTLQGRRKIWNPGVPVVIMWA